jgi:hypothetical protein
MSSTRYEALLIDDSHPDPKFWSEKKLKCELDRQFINWEGCSKSEMVQMLENSPQFRKAVIHDLGTGDDHFPQPPKGNFTQPEEQPRFSRMSDQTTQKLSSGYSRSRMTEQPTEQFNPRMPEQPKQQYTAGYSRSRIPEQPTEQYNAEFGEFSRMSEQPKEQYNPGYSRMAQQPTDQFKNIGFPHVPEQPSEQFSSGSRMPEQSTEQYNPRMPEQPKEQFRSAYSRVPEQPFSTEYSRVPQIPIEQPMTGKTHLPQPPLQKLGPRDIQLSGLDKINPGAAHYSVHKSPRVEIPIDFRDSLSSTHEEHHV